MKNKQNILKNLSNSCYIPMSFKKYKLENNVNNVKCTNNIAFLCKTKKLDRSGML